MDILSAKWKWHWYQEPSLDEANCGIYTEAAPGQAYAVVRCPRYFTEEQWTKLATHICDLHNREISND